MTSETETRRDSNRVIFLDVDGVLNSTRTIVAQHRARDLGNHKLDAVALALLRRLCKLSGAQVVISSTWRIGRTVDFFDFMDLPIRGRTGEFSVDSCRGDEIQAWLDVNKDVTDYIIIDDDIDMLEHQLSRFCRVGRMEGFLLRDYIKCARMLDMVAETQGMDPQSEMQL